MTARTPFISVAALLAVIASLLGFASPTAVSAQSTGRLDLAGQTPYVNADGDFEVALVWTGPRTPELQLTMTVHGLVSDESELNSQPGEVLNRTQPVPLDEIATNSFGQLVATVPIRSFTPADDGRLWLDRAGVYPITAEIRGPDGPVASTRTNLIRLPTEAAEIDLLPVGIILSVETAEGLTVSEISQLLANHPTVPVSVLLGQGVLAQLEDDVALAEEFRVALNGRPVLAVPELNLDPSALAEIGQGELYATALAATRGALVDLGLRPTETVLPITQSLTTEGAHLLVTLGIEQVVDIGSNTRAGGRISTPDGSLDMVRIDDDLTDDLVATNRAESRAHGLLARLAVRYETDRTPVVLGGPAMTTAKINSLDILLSAVDQLGLLVAVELADTASGAVPIRPAERPSQDLLPLTDDIDAALATITTYEAFHVTGGISPEQLRADLAAALSRDLNPENRNRALAAVIDNIDDGFDVITLAEPESVTLAARSSIIPLTINNAASGPRAVMLRFRTDKVAVAQDGQIIELPSGTSQLDIEVEARSLGLSPLEMTVVTPDRGTELARTTVQVRSTAVPGLGMLLSGAALFFLLVWWGRSIARSRRAAEPGGGDPDGTAVDSDADAAAADVRPVVGAEA